MTERSLVLGVDVGTQGVRALLVAPDGTVVARGHRELPTLAAGPIQEQDPADWWSALVGAVGDLGDRRAAVVSVAVSCTSGSVCAVDDDGVAVMPSLMYSDTRALPPAGTDPSWAVGKIAWLVSERADLVARTALFTSPGGWITGRLTGGPTPIDVTQALKFGFDPSRESWDSPPVPATLLPSVVPTGTVIGGLGPVAAAATGLPADAVVVAGATDGVAGHLACRPSPDRWAVTIGSTIVWKALSRRRLDVADQGIYSHRGPDGWWLPGAASNAGARILATWATPADLETFDAEAVVAASTTAAYPSIVLGERFPFCDPSFAPWSVPGAVGIDRYAAEILGVAFVERWGCEVLADNGCTAPGSIVTAGGTSSAATWTQVRADVLQVPIEVPVEPSSAFGAAIIASAGHHGGILAAGEAMVRVGRRVDPDPDGARRWSQPYREFRERCSEHGEGAR